MGPPLWRTWLLGAALLVTLAAFIFLAVPGSVPMHDALDRAVTGVLLAIGGAALLTVWLYTRP
ncbi:hypothetical protein [Cognatilysobacter bugurensis]|uniref:Uncharacterized protein n=1 Tax=Cognatilysobacter bugurensis TaxID=543356 RepID=A0A918SY70_9GAMM|nr:hypothetical protein [Lysobacter bugurensis]GHA77755.1 hypothetical protein GCM10007067_14100 [Lysobacter bugurensis]